MKNTFQTLILAALVGNVQAVDSTVETIQNGHVLSAEERELRHAKMGALKHDLKKKQASLKEKTQEIEDLQYLRNGAVNQHTNAMGRKEDTQVLMDKISRLNNAMKDATEEQNKMKKAVNEAQKALNAHKQCMKNNKEIEPKPNSNNQPCEEQRPGHGLPCSVQQMNKTIADRIDELRTYFDQLADERDKAENQLGMCDDNPWSFARGEGRSKNDAEKKKQEELRSYTTAMNEVQIFINRVLRKEHFLEKRHNFEQKLTDAENDDFAERYPNVASNDNWVKPCWNYLLNNEYEVWKQNEVLNLLFSNVSNDMLDKKIVTDCLINDEDVSDNKSTAEFLTMMDEVLPKIRDDKDAADAFRKLVIQKLADNVKEDLTVAEKKTRQFDEQHPTAALWFLNNKGVVKHYLKDLKKELELLSKDERPNAEEIQKMALKRIEPELPKICDDKAAADFKRNLKWEIVFAHEKSLDRNLD